MNNIILTERQLKLWEMNLPSMDNNSPLQKIRDEKAGLEDYIESHGEYMKDITNGKTYMVQYLKALSELVGKRYAMCAPVHKNGTYGAFYVKPYDTFKKCTGVTDMNNPIVSDETPNTFQPMKLQGNMYQKLGFNKN